MKVNISREGKYIPEWRENRELPEDEQVVIEHNYLSHDERQKFIHIEKPSYTIEVEGKSDAEIEDQLENQTRTVQLKAWDDKDDIAVACKPRIKNLEDMAGNPIIAWAELLAAPQTKENQIRALVIEITDYLADLSKEKDSKNFA